MPNKNEQKCCKKQLELAGLIRNLCATLENEENECREAARTRPRCEENVERPVCGKAKSQTSAPKCVLQCTPCRKLPLENDTADCDDAIRRNKRNAVPNLCTTTGGVSTNHLYVNRWVRPDPSKVPLITYPEYANLNERPKNNEVQFNGRQIMGGVVYDACYCSKRNGLQDDCPLSKCRERPGCKALPEPCCPNMCEERLRVAKRACEEGRYGSPSTLYCPEY